MSMVEIRGLQNCAGIGFSLRRGEIKVIGKEIAEDLIRAGFAEPTTTRSKAETATTEPAKETRQQTTKSKKK